MKQWQADFSMDDFFQRIGHHDSLLLLDYDGTLAPFQIDPKEARPFPEVMERVNRVMAAGRTAVIIISGRALWDLVPLLQLESLPELWGLHGGERRTTDGRVERIALSAAQAEGLVKARQAIDGKGGRLEEKGISLALHWRGLPALSQQSLAATADREWGRLCPHYNLEVLTFDGGREIRPAGLNKGHAVATLVAEHPDIAARHAIAYIGDDTTDEDAFAAMKGRGLSVLVNATLNPATKADIQLISVDELVLFLDHWIAGVHVHLPPSLGGTNPQL